MRLALIASLEAVFDACDGALRYAPSHQNALFAALASHTVSSAVYGLYVELVEALATDDMDVAQTRLDMLLLPRVREPNIAQITNLDEMSLGSGIPALYARLVDDDADMPTAIAGVDQVEFERARGLHGATAHLLSLIAPELIKEMDLLAPQIVAVRDAGSSAPPGDFSGATTFHLWGSIFVNTARLRTRPQMAEALVHEAAHALLLGKTMGRPMVNNDPGDRYTSPLRADPRPMDGIVHASFVLARMVWCQDRLLESGLLRDDENDEAAFARAQSYARFKESCSVIAENADFTSDGARLWTAARNWVGAQPSAVDT